VAFSFTLGRNFVYPGSLSCSKVFLDTPRVYVHWALFTLRWDSSSCLFDFLTCSGFFGGFSSHQVIIFLQPFWCASSVGSPSHWAFPPVMFFLISISPECPPWYSCRLSSYPHENLPVNWIAVRAKSLLHFRSRQTRK
jgi:hypothetical protein